MENLTEDQRNYIFIKFEHLKELIQVAQSQKDTGYRVLEEMELPDLMNELYLIQEIFNIE
ncbi:MAG: hypothetical protein WCO97_06950 [bacterium]